MKKILIFTTTIILIFCLAPSFAFAAELERIAPTSVDYKLSGFTPGEVLWDSGSWSFSDFVPSDDFPDGFPGSYHQLIYPEGEFDYYVGTRWTPNVVQYNEWYCALTINYPEYSLKNFNSVRFSVGVFVESSGSSSSDSYDPWDSVWIEYPGWTKDDYTLTYSVSDPKLVIGTTDRWFRTIDVQVYFPETYLFNTDEFLIHASSWIPVYTSNAGPSIGYAFGITDLYCEVITSDGLLENISGAINDTHKQVTIISNILSSELTPDQAQKLADAEVRRETVETYEAEIQDNFDEVYNKYVSGADPIINDDVVQNVDDGLENVYDNVEASSLIFGFWNNEFIMTCVILTLSFVGVGYALYGQRGGS